LATPGIKSAAWDWEPCILVQSVDEQTSFSILDSYTENGGGFLDSANKYASWVPGFCGGESESLIGKWMKQKGNRETLFVASKVGFPYGEIPRTLKKEIIISECEKSLKRLGVENLDLYFAHAFDSFTPAEETMEAFFRLKREGKIRFAGASNYSSWQLSEANTAVGNQGWEGFCSIQQQHTYLEPHLRTPFGNQVILTPEMAHFCTVKNITIIAYSPLMGGAYTRTDDALPIQFQNSDSGFKLKILKQIANELQVSANAVVLAWMIQSSPPVIPLVSGSSLNQLKENLQVLKFKLSKEQLIRLDQRFESQSM
jgi:aryl-alcohol dehydrogenase-like predicted oxidoreductase